MFPATTRGKRLDEDNVGRIVSAIGEAAGVVVDKESGKFASAHDLRRGFGKKWSFKLMPAALKELMRHKDINTTMKYYAGQDAESLAASIWTSVGQKPQNVSTSVSSRANQHANSVSGG